ncbi:MAG: Crp/Fnr family transcriptional regulator [Gammaproteobacteria bacterium]
MFKYQDLHQYYTRFCPISDDNWRRLEAELKPVSFDKGQALVRQNQPTPNLFAIREGVVRTFYTTPDGKEVVKIFLTEGQIVSPYNENISGQPPRATSEAVTPVQAIRIPFARLMQILDSSNELMRLHLRLVQSFYAAKEKREYEFLTLDATERYQLFLQEFEPYVDQIPHMYVASYIGVTPVSLSRLRKKLKDR